MVPLALWGFCLLWAFSIGYFSRYSPVFMLFERNSYDQIRVIEFERRMGAVGGQLSDLIASQWRFNDASKIPLERRRCFALMSMNRSYPYLNHGKAVNISCFHRFEPSFTDSQASWPWPRRCTCHSERLPRPSPTLPSLSSSLETTRRTPIISHSWAFKWPRFLIRFICWLTSTPRCMQPS